MAYFLKLVGMSDDPLPETWWEDRPELVSAVFFSRCPKSIHPHDHLIYYAVGGSKRIVAKAEVLGDATQDFKLPADWNPRQRSKFTWQMPVRLLSRCTNNDDAPLITDFYTKRIGQSSYIGLTDEQGASMAKAIKSCGHR